MSLNHRRTRKSCPYFKPLSDLPYSQSYNTSCKNCIYFSSKNCHQSSVDEIDSDFDLF